MLKSISLLGMGLITLAGLNTGCASHSDGNRSPQAIQASDRSVPEPQRGADNPGYIDPHAHPESIY